MVSSEASTSAAEACHASVLHYLDRCVEICDRLTFSKGSSDEPLGILLEAEIQALQTQVYTLKFEVANRDLNTVAKALLATKVSLLNTLNLLDFYRHEERRGHDGALNSLFASRYILNRNQDYHGPNAPYSDEKYIRMGKELHELVSSLTQEAVNPAAHAFERHQSRIEAFLHRIHEQFRPRCISKYQTAADVPFIQDTTGPAYSGSFGVVKKVTHKRTRELLAMKTFYNVFSVKEKDQIRREIGLLEVCSHRNIVRYVEAFSMDDDEHTIHLVIAPWAPYTLTKFLRTPDLTRRKQCPWFELNTPKSHRCVYRIMYELSDALGYLHSQSIKHKDLKPDNILLYHEESNYVMPVITDVGVSKIFVRGAATKYTDSTWEYLAPEQHAEKESTPTSDIWQLGCCFAELLAVTAAGTSGFEELHDSFNRDDKDCSCSIAYEHTRFMETLTTICMCGNAALERAFEVTSAMLEVDPSLRLEIGLVKSALSDLPGLTDS
ncbi:kinase-like protein [Xylaria bambusicola]|uniref:kinase-like protein n=1 Tax=Xylaria bambusicola TaxID=326684 RepID=UPI002008604A|nr:kinase-like protein [Xylaria bambusicola]KAI0518273.1 kinase-like protein [Xylaria bambusicola]